MTQVRQREERQLAQLLGNTVPGGLRIPYGQHPDQHLELFGDPATARGVVILLHGGYFRQLTDLTHARPAAQALASAGAVVALVEYRRAGGDGGHPRTLEDVTAAITELQRSWVTWGVEEGAARTPVIAGHSAGGCLALAWASHHGQSILGARVRALAPITDLVREAQLGLAEGAVLDYMGVHPRDELRAYLWEDPRSRAAMIPGDLDVRTLHGRQDGVVSIEFSRHFPAPLTEIDDAGHFDLIDPTSPHFAQVRQVLLRW